MPRDKIRLLYFGDSPTACSGFGTIAREILPRLLDTDRFEILVLGTKYFGDPHPWEGRLKIFPVPGDDHPGQTRIGPMLALTQPTVLLTACRFDELDWFPPVYLDAARQTGAQVPWVWYTSIDGPPLPHQVVTFRDLVDHAVVTSRSGLEQLNSAIPVLDTTLVRPGVDGVAYARIDALLRSQLRGQLGVGDDFVVLGIGTNRPGKEFGTLLRAFAHFRKGKEDAVRLCLHTDPDARGGYDIRQIARRYGFEDELLFTNPHHFPAGLPADQISLVYNIADVAVFPHAGDGLALTKLEAMACGVPVIAHHITATAEVLDETAGALIPTERIPAPRGGGDMEVRVHLPGQDAGRARPAISLAGLVNAMERLFADAGMRRKMGDRGRDLATKDEFSWDKASRDLVRVLTKVATG